VQDDIASEVAQALTASINYISPGPSESTVGCITLNLAGFVVDCYSFQNYGQPTALTFAAPGCLAGARQPAASSSISMARPWRRSRCRTARRVYK